MLKRILCTLSVCLLSLTMLAQTAGIDQVLVQVEQNNADLKALQYQHDARKLELAAGNNLPDPQLSGYYLPFGANIAGAYREVEISQHIAFPGVYKARRTLIGKQELVLATSYSTRRQEVLHQAYQHCLQIIYLNKRLAAAGRRMEQAEQAYQQVEALFEQEQVGVLLYNKAKIFWLQEQFRLQQLQNEKQGLLLLLETLNGGKPVAFDASEYAEVPHLYNVDSLWDQKLQADPEMLRLRQEEAIARQQVKLSEKAGYPGITAGYNYQGMVETHNHGFYAGINLPLWNNRRQVKASRARLHYQETTSLARTAGAEARFRSEYRQYHLLHTRYEAYARTLSGLHSEQLLFKAYQMGEYSFLEYHGEIQFYRDARDTFLEMEYHLHLSHIHLLKHQL